MFKRILAATDGSPRSDKAVTTAIEMARSSGDSRVYALMVVPDYTTLDVMEVVIEDGPSFAAVRASLAQAGLRRLDEVLQRCGADDRVERFAALGDDAYVEIVKTAQRLECDLIVMGSRGRGALASALLGSQTSHVLALAAVPVLVVK